MVAVRGMRYLLTLEYDGAAYAGWQRQKNAVTVQEKVETALRKLLPPEESNDFCHRCVLHGRAVCTARKAHCESCALNSFCKKNI